MRCYQSNVMAHLWLMQDLQDELKKNEGCFIISASVAGLKPVGSSMVSAMPGAQHCSVADGPGLLYVKR